MKLAYLAPVLLLAGGCVGLLGDGGSDGKGSGDSSGEQERCEGVCLGTSGMMRLTRDEYRQSIQAVFGTAVVVDDKRLPADLTAGPFDANDAPVTEAGVADYAAVAWDIAWQVAQDIAATCDASSCADTVLSSYAEDLLRRPLTVDEIDAYTELFSWSAADDPVDEAVALLVATLVQSPSFIYRVETSMDGDEPTLLTGLELATRLSLFLWLEGPDAELRHAAVAGELDTPEGIAHHAARMVSDPRADRALTSFHRQWLGLGELGDDALAGEMRDETEGAALRVYREQGSLADLFTTTTAPVGSELAAHYGVSSGANVDVPGHVGILTHASVMSRYSSVTYTRPVRRADMLLSRVLCHDLGAPPANALDQAEQEAATLEDDMTDREKLEVVTGKAACQGCHTVLNPAGYVFEGYDASGLYRTEDEGGRPIETAGEILGVEGLDGTIDGPLALMDKLVDHPLVAECLSEHWLSYALRRYVSDEDRFSVAEIETGGELERILVAVTTTDAFRYRLPR